MLSSPSGGLYPVVDPQPGHAHRHTLILLHGRDSDAATFAEELLESETTPSAATDIPARTLPEALPSVRWVFPEARELPSERFGQPLRQWFDMWSTEEPLEQPELQLPGLRDSVARVLAVVRAERERLLAGTTAGVNGGEKKIVLGGISQGFATALVACLVGGCRVDALLGFASWLPFRNEILATMPSSGSGTGLDVEAIRRILTQEPDDEASLVSELKLWDNDRSALLKTPVFLAHCADDAVIRHGIGEQLRDGLRALGFNDVRWHSYAEGGHWVNEPRGIDDVVGFIDGLAQEYSKS